MPCYHSFNDDCHMLAILAFECDVTSSFVKMADTRVMLQVGIAREGKLRRMGCEKIYEKTSCIGYRQQIQNVQAIDTAPLVYYIQHMRRVMLYMEKLLPLSR